MINVPVLEYADVQLREKINRYVNHNLQEIVKVVEDFLEDGMEIDNFMVFNKTLGTNEIWKERVYELHDIISSYVVRKYLKPKYEYLLFHILEFWKNIKDPMCDNPVIFEMDEKLKSEIFSASESKEVAECVIDSLVFLDEYFDMLFENQDFLNENLSMIVSLYLNNRYMYERLCSEGDLDEYRELMPQDLLELYDEAKQRDIEIQAKQTLLLTTQEQLDEDIKFCCETVQADYTLIDAKENHINDRIRDLLNAKNYKAKDQTRHGISAGGKDAGNVDVLIESDGEAIALIEALKVDSMKEKYIAKHIDKVFGYDTKGFRKNYILCYAKMKNFQQFAEKYWDFIQRFSYKYTLEKCLRVEEKQYPELRTFETILSRQGVETKLTHILIHMS